MSRYRDFVDMHCMPLPLGFLCWMEDHFPGRDTEGIHNGDHPEDWICKLHDAALNVSAHLGLPICRGTWRK